MWCETLFNWTVLCTMASKRGHEGDVGESSQKGSGAVALLSCVPSTSPTSTRNTQMLPYMEWWCSFHRQRPVRRERQSRSTKNFRQSESSTCSFVQPETQVSNGQILRESHCRCTSGLCSEKGTPACICCV